MAEQTTNYIEIDGEGKYIEDTEAREGVSQNAADITAIVNDLKVIDIPYVPNAEVGGSYLHSDCHYMKSGKVVTFCCGIADVSKTGTITTLPVGYKPRASRILVKPLNNNGVPYGFVEIRNNGDVVIVTAPDAGLFFSVTFVAE